MNKSLSVNKVKNYIDSEVDEEVYAGLTNVPLNTTTPQKVAAGKIASGYDGVIVSVAASQNNNVTVWVKRADKQIYENGLNSAALPANLLECPIYEEALESVEWELGLTNTSGGAIAVAWLIRIRLFRIKK